ncbi:YceI family protein [Immundisolibacter sp.]|uniref:YceI family protein n=1 Tax=Immundisolibacter sp. TaxID=1934948 RepID=UPI0035622A20
MKTQLAVALFTSAIAMPALAVDSYAIDPYHTCPVFEIDHLGFSIQRGRFNKVTGNIQLDLAARAGAIDVTIDSASIDMGFDEWDERMRSDEFFNVEKFPTMRFKSEKLVFDGDKLVGAEGQFTLLGVTKPLTLTIGGLHCAVHPINKKPLCGANATAAIKRSDYGMVKYLPGIGDQVKLIIPVEAFKD